MTSASVQLVFITNTESDKILKDKQDKLALAVAKRILNYPGVKYLEDKPNLIKINLHGKDLEVERIIVDRITYIPTRF